MGGLECNRTLTTDQFWGTLTGVGCDKTLTGELECNRTLTTDQFWQVDFWQDFDGCFNMNIFILLRHFVQLTKSAARAETLKKWQEVWSQNSAWARNLLPEILSRLDCAVDTTHSAASWPWVTTTALDCIYCELENGGQLPAVTVWQRTPRTHPLLLVQQPAHSAGNCCTHFRNLTMKRLSTGAPPHSPLQDSGLRITDSG